MSINSFFIGEQYYKGVLAAYLGSGFMNAPVTEGQIEMIKESISHFCESMIDHSQLSNQEKDTQKQQMKQSLELYIHGVKDQMKATGRLVSG